MPDKEDEESNGTGSKPTLGKMWIAIVVLGVSIPGVIILGGIMIATSDDKSNAAQYVLAAILPLLGTWVGTVLAYYFSKDNFESATKSTKELLGVDQKLSKIKVADVMISYASIIKVEEDDNDKIVLKQWLDTMAKEKKGQRLPVFKSDKSARYGIHKSIINDFLVSEAIKGEDKDKLKAKTLTDLITSKPELEGVIKKFGTVSRDATLEKVKAIMDQSDDTQDVFVTEDGKKTGAVIGWVTNVIVDENSKVS